MYNEPWTSGHFARPAVQQVTGNVDLLRAHWRDDGAALLMTAKGVAGTADAELVVSGLHADRPWSVRRDGQEFASSRRVDASRAALDTSGNLRLRMRVDRATDLIVTA
jgi:hypothetical protein